MFALDYLHGVFSVFGPSVQMSVSNYSLPDVGHTYSVIKMQVFTYLYFLYLLKSTSKWSLETKFVN